MHSVSDDVFDNESESMVATNLMCNEKNLSHMTSNSTFSVSGKVLSIQWDIEKIHFLTKQLILMKWFKNVFTTNAVLFTLLSLKGLHSPVSYT